MNFIEFIPDSSILGLGSGADVQFYHDGSNMTMINTTGSMAFYQSVDDGDSLSAAQALKKGVINYVAVDIPSLLAQVNGANVIVNEFRIWIFDC